MTNETGRMTSDDCHQVSRWALILSVNWIHCSCATHRGRGSRARWGLFFIYQDQKHSPAGSLCWHSVCRDGFVSCSQRWRWTLERDNRLATDRIIHSHAVLRSSRKGSLWLLIVITGLIHSVSASEHSSANAFDLELEVNDTEQAFRFFSCTLYRMLYSVFRLRGVLFTTFRCGISLWGSDGLNWPSIFRFLSNTFTCLARSIFIFIFIIFVY